MDELTSAEAEDDGERVFSCLDARGIMRLESEAVEVNGEFLHALTDEAQKDWRENTSYMGRLFRKM